jgi:hypothetical protein
MADQWLKKFKRENPFMPFGSICNMLGQIYHEVWQDKDFEELPSGFIEKLIDLAWEKSKEMVDEKYKEAVEEEKAHPTTSAQATDNGSTPLF